MRYSQVKQPVATIAGVNNELEKIANSIDDMVSRKAGDGPNTLDATLDANSQRIINLPEPVTNTEPVRKADFDELGNKLRSDVYTAVRDAEDATDDAIAAANSANAATNSANSAANRANTAASNAYQAITDLESDGYAVISQIESDGYAVISQIESDGQSALDALRVVNAGSFEDGGTLTARNEVLYYLAEQTYYRWDGALPKTVAASSTPASTGGVGAGAWVDVGDSVLRSDLANPDKGAAMVARATISTLSIKDLLETPVEYLRDGVQFSVASFYEGKNQGGGMFYWDPYKDKIEANGGTIIDPDHVGGFDGTYEKIGDFLNAQGSGSGVGCFVRFGFERINPKMFGFIADSDDHNIPIIRKTFHASGELRIPVEFSGISELNLHIPDTPINIYYDVDFQGCVLKMIDAVFPPEEVDWGYPSVFEVPAQHKFSTIDIDQQTLTWGSTRIKTENGDPLENGFYILRTERLLPPRYLNGQHIAPEKFRQAFAVYSGESTLGVALDVSDRTDSYLQYRPFCEPMEIKGLTIDPSSFNNLTILHVLRDNTRVTDFMAVGGSSKESINSILNIANCCNVTVDKFVCPQNYNKDGDGSYTISMSTVSDILFDNITSTGNPRPATWGAFGSNRVGNITIRNSRLGRFDSHSGLFGRTVIEGCYFVGNSFHYGWGAGEINISRSKFVDVQGIVVQRGDYWGNFDGDIIINDCNIEITDALDILPGEEEHQYGNIFVCPSIGRNVDPSYENEVLMCRRLIIRNISVRRPKTGNPTAKCHIIRLITSTEVPQPTVDVYYPQSVEVDGLYVDREGGEVTFTFHVSGKYFSGHPYSQCVLRNIDNNSVVRRFLDGSGPDASSSLFVSLDRSYTPTAPVFSKVIIDSCRGVAAFTPETSDFLVTNSEVLNWRFNTESGGTAVNMEVPITFNNCRFNYAAPLPSTNDIRIPNRLARFYNCHFDAQFNHINAKSAIGCTFGDGITITSQNAPEDKGLWFTGFSEDTGWDDP